MAGSERSSPVPRLGQGKDAARMLRAAITVSAAVGGRLPPGIVARLAAAGGTIEWAVRPRKRAILATNLAHALSLPPEDPRVRRAVRAEVAAEARRSADFLWSVAHPERVAAATRIEGLDGLTAALDGGRGAILAGPHVGGWEVVTPLAATVGVEITALVEDDWLAWAVAGIRSRAGLRLVPTSVPPVRLARALREGGVVAVLADLAKPGMRAVEVSLVGDPVLLPAGPAALARITGAPMIPVAVLPIASRAWRLVLGRPIAAPPRSSGRGGERRAVQALADAWSEVLRRHPTEWAAVDPMPWR
jgi:phosphatidylinositol dimannoside acyltransferase